jgi:hypothetical protein
VLVYNADTNNLEFALQPFETSFRGGVRVATGDVNGDGAADIIVGSGPGRMAQVNVYDGSTGQQIAAFNPYGPKYRGGVFVASGDLNGDGKDEIIVGPGSGALPVEAFTRFGTPLPGFIPFYPYGQLYTGGVHVASSDTGGPAGAVIVTAPAHAGNSVRVFNASGQIQTDIPAYARGFRDGIWVALGDLLGNGQAEVVVGPGAGRADQVEVFDAISGALIRKIDAFPQFSGGIRVGIIDLHGDHKGQILAARGAFSQPLVKGFDGATGAEIYHLFAFPKSYLGGLFVA